MLKPKKDYSAFFNRQALAKAHELPGAPHSPRRQIEEIKPGVIGDVGGLLGIGNKIVTGITGMYDMLKEYTLGKRDIPFDIIALSLAEEQVGGAVYPATILTQQLGTGEQLIIQNFCFFTTVDNAPVNPVERNIMADPLEYVFNYRFSLLGNGIPIGRNVYFNPAFNYDGFASVTQDPANFDPQQCIRYVVKPGQVFTVVVDRFAVLLAAQRVPINHGARIRGFLRPFT